MDSCAADQSAVRYTSRGWCLKDISMILVLLLLNFAISWVNAWGCGATWDGSKAKGGLAHFMNWMGAVMSASGFTWCYLVVVGAVGTLITVTNEETGIAAPLLEPAMAQSFYDLGYIIIIFPILGSGLAITVASWRSFARRRTLGRGLLTGWNTYAQANNTYHAVRSIPGVFDRLGRFFGKGSGGKIDDSKGMIVVLLVVLALFGGVLTTYGILQAKRRTVRQSERRMAT